MPALTGNGLAMRSGMVLEALAGVYRVSVLVVPLYVSAPAFIPFELASLCERVEIVPPTSDVQSRVDQAGVAYVDSHFDVVHVFRLSTMPFARPYLGEGEGRARRHLDLDDIDSKTHRRIAALARDNGDSNRAGFETAEAQRSELLEVMAFRLFDRIYVCSEQDRATLSTRCKARIAVLPNAVRRVATVGEAPEPPPFRFLFLGTLGYYPNQDAVVFFCTRILPLIRATAAGPVEVEIVGGGGSDALKRVAALRGATFIGPVASVEACYQRANAVVVPLRAGGGTRIKILEAFSYGRPVVATTLGVEGIRAEPGKELLVGDTPEQFAARCVELMIDRCLAQALVQNARSLLERSYSAAALQRVVAGLAADGVPRESKEDAS